MDIENLKQLIEDGKESEVLDFKEKYHDNKARLLHDILCLANNTSFNEAYIVFGINDNGETVGVENHEKRLNSANIQDLLQSKESKFFNNSVPEVEVHTMLCDGHDIDILMIKSTFQVPYFLVENYKDKDNSDTVWAGHIYTRTGSRNTPINGCASSQQTIELWKKRFGLLETPLKKLSLYLDDISGWKRESAYEYYSDSTDFYYEPDPSLKIHTEIFFDDTENLPRYQALPYKFASMYKGKFECKSNELIIRRGDIFLVDSGRTRFPDTEYVLFQVGGTGNLAFSLDYYIKDSIEYKLISLLNPIRDGFQDAALNQLLEQTPVFPSRNVADAFINYVRNNVPKIISSIELESGIEFTDAPYDPEKHDLFRISTGRVLNKIFMNMSADTTMLESKGA